MDTTNQEVNQLLNSVPEYIQKVKCDTTVNTAPFKCAVKICTNQFINFYDRNKYPYKFHKFPLNKKLRKIWKLKCGWNKHDNLKHLMVCSDHFKLNDYLRNYKEEFRNPYFKRKLKINAFPTEKLGPMEVDISVSDISEDYYETDAETEIISSEKTDNIKSINMLSNFSKECQEFIAQIETKVGPLDYDEVKHEVDYHRELCKKQMELEKELKTLKIQKKVYDKQAKNALNKISQIKNRRASEYKIIKRIFSKAQIDLLRGKKAYWTDEDLARAFTLRHMGTKRCYLYMKNKLNVPLPALSCVQKWASAYK